MSRTSRGLVRMAPGSMSGQSRVASAAGFSRPAPAVAIGTTPEPSCCQSGDLIWDESQPYVDTDAFGDDSGYGLILRPEFYTTVLSTCPGFIGPPSSPGTYTYMVPSVTTISGTYSLTVSGPEIDIDTPGYWTVWYAITDGEPAAAPGPTVFSDRDGVLNSGDVATFPYVSGERISIGVFGEGAGYSGDPLNPLGGGDPLLRETAPFTLTFSICKIA